MAALSPNQVVGLSLVRSSPSRMSASKCLPMGMRRQGAIRCQVEPPSEGSTTSPSLPSAVPLPTPAPIPTLAATTKTSSGFFDVLGFGGSGPETINGRLAMVGFVACVGVEAATGAPLTRQLADRASIISFLCTIGLFSVASLVPLFQGITPEKKSGGIGGIFTSKAEMWNGRAAMMGLVALAITEYVKGSSIV